MTLPIVLESFDAGLYYIAECCKALTADRQTPIAIGIAGGSASGKTRFAAKLVDCLGTCAVLSMDDYYHTRAYRQEQGISNFDDPRAFNLSLFAEHLRVLLGGEVVYAPSYSFKTSESTEAARRVEPAPLIIADGLFILLPELEFSFHLTVFLKTSRQEMLRRRIQRDIERTLQTSRDIARMFEEEVYPAYEKHVLPTAQHADVIVKNNWRVKE